MRALSHEQNRVLRAYANNDAMLQLSGNGRPRRSTYTALKRRGLLTFNRDRLNFELTEAGREYAAMYWGISP